MWSNSVAQAMAANRAQMRAQSYMDRASEENRRKNSDETLDSLDSVSVVSRNIENTLPAPTMGGASILLQTAVLPTVPQGQPAVLSVQERSGLVDYLFEMALSTLGSLEVSNRPSLFLVYAHDSPTHGKADASTSKYLIEKLSQIQVVLYSDQTPVGQPYSSAAGALKKDSKLEDILTNQLCLLPGQLRSDVKPVDKVIVCCSEVLGSYLKWSDYDNFYQQLRKAYREDRKAYLKDGRQANAWGLREVVRQFSQEGEYKAGFHHVLTEMAFLQIRAEELKNGHGIIPVPLTRNSYDDCLSRFTAATTVRMEDIPRFEAQAQAGRAVYPNQSRHWVLFKLIERLLVDSDEARTFLNKFWQGYNDCLSRLNDESSPLGPLEFAQQLNGIFDEIERSLHKQLASAVQQVYPAWQQVETRLLNQSHDLAQIQTGIDSLVARLLVNLQENIQKLRTAYLEGLQQDREIKDALANYVPLEGMLLHDSTRFDLESKVQEYLSSEKKTLLLLGDAGSGKSTFNRRLAVSLWDAYTEGSPSENKAIPVFIALSSLRSSNHNLVTTFFESQGFSKEQIEALQKKQSFVFILDGYDELEDRQRAFYKDNQLNDWKEAKIIISSRPEYLGSNYQYKFHSSGERSALQEYQLAPFSGETIEEYVDQYKKVHPEERWSAEQYKEALRQRDVEELVGNPFLLKITLSVLPELSKKLQANGQRFTRIGLYDEFVNNWFERSQQRLAQIQLNPKETEAFRDLDKNFPEQGVDFSKELATEMYKAGEVVATYSTKTNNPWKKPNAESSQIWRRLLLGNDNAMTVLMRLNAPLICQGDQYRFIHKSLQDYFVARALWEELGEPVEGEQVELSKKLSLVVNLRPLWEGLGNGLEFEKSSLFNELNIVEDPAVLGFLVEQVRQDRSLLKPLLGWVRASKTQDDVERAAANALTILVKINVQLNGWDLSKIKVPAADLSYGVFDKTGLEGADLRHVKFRGVWLRGANLEKAKLDGVNFGELPSLEIGSEAIDCSYSSDGRWLAVGTFGGVIKLYQTGTFELVQILLGHSDRVNSVSFSRSGELLASGSRDGTMRLWRAESGELLRTLSEHDDSVWSVDFSPIEELLASGGADGTVKLWRVESGELLRTLPAHNDSVHCVSFSPSEKIVASGGSDFLGGTDYAIKLWQVESGELLRTLSGHSYTVNCLSFSRSGELLVSGSRDRTAKLWQVESGELLQILPGHGGDGVSSVTFSPSEEVIVSSGGWDRQINLWRVKDGELLQTLPGHSDGVSRVNFSPSGEILVSTHKNALKLWRFESGAELQMLSEHHYDVTSVSFSASGELVASGSWDGTVMLWRVENRELLQTLSGHSELVWKVSFSWSGDLLASGSRDGTVKLWRVESGELLHTLLGHRRDVTSVSFSPSGELLASGSWDGTVKLWQVESGELLQTLSGHSESVKSLSFSPSGELIASGDGAVRLWRVESGELLHTLLGHHGNVTSVNFSPSGEILASGGEDSKVKLWQVESGESLQTLLGHSDFINYVSFSPSGEFLVSGSKDRTVKLWSVKTGECKATVRGFVGEVVSMVWEGVSNKIGMIAGWHGKGFQIWQLDSSEKAPQEDKRRASLYWSSVQSQLTLVDMSVQNVQGLGPINTRLLKQRGALVEPE